ncbi:Putative phage tail protein [Devosia lucknowensis]|uniref:Putative phage tail protein n=1 Tax=Devosia lucknowensis TaxID=1096929 RepID=A0A1Y6ESY7_9HYPH|nr:phage tail protein [Devosia lucknowensis]SMQ65834.1 Putative phage tail protein [Devosia lucknowensis]
MAVFTWIGASIFGAGTFLAGLTAAGLQIAAGVVMSSLGRSASSGEQTTQKFGVQGRLQGGEDVPRSINLGWNCTAGSLVWHNTFGDGGTMSARVMAIGDLPIRELLYPIVDGVDCTLLKGEIHPNYGWPVAEYRKGGVDHLWIKFYDGNQTAADPFLVSNFAGDPNRPYQSTRVGRGVPYVIVFARAPERNDEGDKPLFQGIPTFKFVSNGVRWYNPALDSTVGGVGTHRWDNPATWGGVGDFNPIVQLYNVLRGVRFSGQWLYGMQGLSAARLPVANWIAGINAAQTGIDGPSGVEPTFRSGGEVQVGAKVAVTAEALLTAANSRLVENGGVYTVYVGPPGAPVMAFTDGDILSTEEQSFSPFLSLSDTVNGMDASYPNPGEGWNNKKAPPLLRPDLEVQAGNRRLMASVSLDLVPYAAQVQRLMRWALNEALRARRHTFVLGPEFRVIEPGDVVRWTSERNGYVDKLFRVDGVIYKWNLDVIVDLTEVDPADYDWDQETDYRPVINGPLQLVGPRPMPMSGWQVFPAPIPDESGAGRRPSIEVRFASGVPSVDRVRVQVRVGDEDGPLIFDSDAHPYVDPWRAILQGQFPPNVTCVVRGIFIGPAAAEWSGWLPVTTPNVKLGADDIAIDLSNVAKDVLAQVGSNRSIIEAFKRIGTMLEEADRENYVKRESLFREVQVELEGLEASFTEIIEVALGPGGAIAQKLESLYAAMGGNSAEVNIRWFAEAGPEGMAARYVIQAAANDGTFRAGTFFIDVPLDPTKPVVIGVMAGQFVNYTSDGVPIVMLGEDGVQRSANGVKMINWVTGAERTDSE